MTAGDRPTQEVIILGLGPAESGSAEDCGGGCGWACVSTCATSGGTTPLRVRVLECRDALVAAGATVTTVTATSDQEIDGVLSRLDGPGRPDGLTWPAVAGDPALVLVVESDAQLRAVVRRMVRRWAPPPSKRPADLVAGRTVPDLPPVGLLPLNARGPGKDGLPDLLDRLRLPRDPAEVAKAVLDGAVRRVDLLRTDGGSVTVHGALLGGVDASGRAAAWRGRVELDDTVLADGSEPVLACAVANANGYAHLDELPLAPTADPSNGTVTVAVAVPVRAGSRFSLRRATGELHIEVRRASGRAVSVTPSTDLPYVDDGVAGTLTRKRAWWVEPGAWAVYAR